MASGCRASSADRPRQGDSPARVVGLAGTNEDAEAETEDNPFTGGPAD
jgi:hypothetical protein